ncbi:MAG TPA: hypothetical protein VJT73_18695, partial [Polyangiaceae bacterium]|nr:hypothetical protein [Polyangiaceae bacterium]
MRHYIPFSVSRTFWMPAAFAAVFTAGAAFAEAPPAPTLPPLPAPPPAPGYQQPPPAPGYQQPPPAPGYQQP